MTVTYALTDETYSYCHNDRISYGITAYAYEAPDSRAGVIVSVKDITSDKNRLEKLVRSCNQLKLSPTHLYGVIEDFLNG